MQAKSFNLLDQQKIVRDIVADESNPSFFILNNTDRPGRDNKSSREAGTMLFTILDDSNQSRVIRIPVSWVPIDAAVQASKKSIAQSAEFQRALSTGAIIVMTHDEGISIIKRDAESEEEYANVMAVSQGINGPNENITSNAPREQEDPWANVSPNVKIHVEDVKTGLMSNTEFKSFLRRFERSVSALDKRYITEELPNLHS